jgi:glutathione synthase/RimK-type ligase-like ATP-grasp enzyme
VNLAPEFARALYAECDAGLAALFQCLPCPVVNRLADGLSNESKPYQALRIRRCGLLTPPTLVTNDPQQACQFYEQCDGQVIYKSISGARSIVRRMNVERFARLPLLRHGPVQFQAFIAGDDIRVHTVGAQCFATRIRSKAVDYRYASDEKQAVEMKPATLPSGVATACLEVARHFGLSLAGIDLKETPESDYYCFEVNPSPEFFWYEQAGRQPISTALAELLQGSDTATSVPRRDGILG